MACKQATFRWFLCVSTLLVLTIQSTLGAYCEKYTGGQQPGWPALPKIDDVNFKLKIQGTILKENQADSYTFYSEENYDSIEEAVKIIVKKDGKESGYILDFKNKAFVQYQYSDLKKSNPRCTIQDIEDAGDNLDVFGGSYIQGDVSKNQKNISKNILRFSEDLGEKYIGQKTIDGIQVNHWESCINWKDDRDTFKVHYYFTLPEWTPYNTFKKMAVPVRMEVEGEKTDKDSGAVVEHIHHIYEYLDYTPMRELKEGELMIPPDMDCIDPQGLRSHVPFPEIPNQLAWIQEEVQPVTGRVDLVEVQFDYDNKIAMTKSRTAKIIMDYTMGTKYTIDTVSESCTAAPLEERYTGIQEGNGLRMVTQKELFHLDREMQYHGLTVHNQLIVNEWRGTFQKDGTPVSMNVFFVRKTDFDQSMLGNEPMVGRKETPENGNPVIYNMVGWSPTVSSDINDLDVSGCHPVTVKRIRVTFSGTSLGSLGSQLSSRYVTKTLAYRLAASVDASPLQVVPLDIFYNQRLNKIFFTAKILRPLEDAQRNAQMQPEDKKQAVQTSSFFANLETEIRRGGVYIKLQSDYQVVLTATAIDSLDDDIEIIRRRANPLDNFILHKGKTATDVTELVTHAKTSAADCAAACLKSRVECTGFSLTKDMSCTAVYRGSYPESSLVASADGDFYTRDFSKYFDQAPGLIQRPTGKDYILKNGFADCALDCVKAPQGKCLSFDICDGGDGGKKMCYMYNIRTDPDAGASADSSKVQSCTRFIKQTILDYKVTPSKTLDSISSNFQALTVPNANICAQSCSSIPTCTTFSFCEVSKQCLLLRRDFSDVTTKVSKGCSVFTSVVSDPSASQLIANAGDSDGGGGYTSSDMAGLGFTMLILSTAGTATALYVLAKRGIWNGLNLST